LLYSVIKCLKPDSEKLILAESFNEDNIIIAKKSFLIKNSDIISINYKLESLFNPDIPNSGTITINLYAKKKKKLLILDKNSEEQLIRFFCGADFKSVSAGKGDADDDVISFRTPAEKRLISKMKLVYTVVSVCSVIFAASFIFLGFDYKTMAITNMLIPIIIFILYVKYNDIFSIAENKSSNQTDTMKS